MNTIKKFMAAFVANHRSILMAAQAAGVLWIGYELHGISEYMYTGPGSYSPDVLALEKIADMLDDIKRAIIFSR